MKLSTNKFCSVLLKSDHRVCEVYFLMKFRTGRNEGLKYMCVNNLK